MIKPLLPIDSLGESDSHRCFGPAPGFVALAIIYSFQQRRVARLSLGTNNTGGAPSFACLLQRVGGRGIALCDCLQAGPVSNEKAPGSIASANGEPPAVRITQLSSVSIGQD